MTGGGLKKCMPITRSGRSVAAPSVAIGIDDVFEASTTSGFVISSSAAERLELGLGILGGRLDHEVDVGEGARRRSSRSIAAEDRVAVLGGELASLERPAGRGLDALAAGRRTRSSVGSR